MHRPMPVLPVSTPVAHEPLEASDGREVEQKGLPPIPPAVPLAEPIASASGRRTLSTAFVRIGPDGYLTVERQDGKTLLLRDVTMGRRGYCGLLVTGEQSGTRYCGKYVEVAAARPGR